nr:MAG: hypothetical protein [Penaeus semisulcatus pemonivirus]
MDSPISHHNRLAGQVFMAIADSQSKNESSFSVGTHCILRSIGPLFHDAVNETVIADPSLKPKGENLEVTVDVYTGGKRLNYKNQPHHNKASKKMHWIKAAYEIDMKSAARMGHNTCNTVSPEEHIPLDGKGQTAKRSIAMAIAGTTTFSDKWSANNNFEKSRDIKFYTRGEGEKRTSAIRAIVNALFRSSMENELCADAIRLDMESGAFYLVVMPKIPATKDELTSLAMTIDWGQFHDTFRKINRRFMVQLPRITTLNSFNDIGKILSRINNLGISSLLSSDKIEVSSISNIEIVHNKTQSNYETVLPKICKRKELRINKPFLFVHGAENGMIIDMGMYLKPLE